jgi:lysozyme
MFSFMKNKPVVKNTALGLVTAAMVSAGVFLGLADDKGAPMTAEFEGTVLANYIDAVGVETWCTGETQMGRLEKGYTREYCMKLFVKSYSVYSRQVYSCYNETAKKYVTPSMHAAFTDVFYNAGAGCKSNMIGFLKVGQPVKACNVILQYKRAGGKDCSVRSNGCYGVWDRRLKVYPLCVSDAQKLPIGGLK